MYLFRCKIENNITREQQMSIFRSWLTFNWCSLRGLFFIYHSVILYLSIRAMSWSDKPFSVYSWYKLSFYIDRWNDAKILVINQKRVTVVINVQDNTLQEFICVVVNVEDRQNRSQLLSNYSNRSHHTLVTKLICNLPTTDLSKRWLENCVSTSWLQGQHKSA